jgi:hypothetical protein
LELTQNANGALNIAKPGTYEGERQTATIDGWIRSLERYFECNRADDTKKILFASSLLRGPADIWWRSMEKLEDDKKITTWATFKSKLEERFKHKNAHREARNRLANLKQTTTVQTYIDQFHMIHLELPDITEDELLDRFIRGLKPAVQTHVLGQDPLWLSQAEHQALVFENAHSVQAINNPQPMDLDVIRQQQRNEPLRCYNCGGIGHLQRVCPSNRNQQPRYNNRQQPRYNNGGYYNRRQQDNRGYDRGSNQEHPKDTPLRN